ncbi:hypothetical protein CCACVL1_13397 [Corchorus capsularis]|uniref:BZIP domain-containing protein n=1 Tax=Corchorus capsularis TaxID=210143 RepID=A0A1R3IB65_COCAP|nr:hypothetical protein CCACVL1_13397 [Corchorus capsularis]
MVQRRALNPAQRNAKNRRDRQRRLEHNLEFERLRMVEANFKALAPLLVGLQDQLMSETDGAVRRLSLTPWQFKEGEPSRAIVEETQEILLSLTGKKEPPHESSHTQKQYSDEFIEEFIEKLGEKEKSRVDFPDFKGLTEELEKSGRLTLPPSLVPIHETLEKSYGDITAESNQSIPLIRDSYILFCSVIKEMNQLQLEHVDLNKLMIWRDAINSGLSIGFKGDFAIDQLKKIARAYFGFKAQTDKELKNLEDRISELKAELNVLEKKHNRIVEEKRNSEMRRLCQRDQEYFQGKPLSTGLFPK